jgi:hypothetical protein
MMEEHMYWKETKQRLGILAGACGLLLSAACSGDKSPTAPEPDDPQVRPEFVTRICSPWITGVPITMHHARATISTPGVCAT